jgi:hypothetical protein
MGAAQSRGGPTTRTAWHPPSRRYPARPGVSMAISKWHIDAWAVRDGAAFASRREFNSREAENTVFIAVPDLEPVPVGRLATALSATRRSFQAGLWNENGVEIAFESLEQIAELVRRAFLASGLGFGGSAAPLPGGERPAPGGSDEGSAPMESGGSPPELSTTRKQSLTLKPGNGSGAMARRRSPNPLSLSPRRVQGPRTIP